MISVFKRLAMILGGFGAIIIIYLIVPREPLPLMQYDNAPAVDSGYQYDTRYQHISLQQSYDTSDGIIRYLDLGKPNSKPILLVHGTPTSSWMYRYLIEKLIKDGGYRIIAVDMLGYGNSDKPIGPQYYSTKSQSDRIVSLMSHLGIDSRTQVVHDMGGTRTWQLLIDHPGQISQLIILNTLGFDEGFHPPAMMKSRPRIGYYFSKLITVDIFSRLIMTQTIKGMVTNPDLLTSDMIDGYLYPTMRGQWRTYGYFLSNLSTIIQELNTNQSYLQSYPELIPPTHIIRGAQDTILTVDQTTMFQIRRQLSSEDITIIEAGKHLIAEEYVETIVSILNS